MVVRFLLLLLLLRLPLLLVNECEARIVVPQVVADYLPITTAAVERTRHDKWINRRREERAFFFYAPEMAPRLRFN